MSKYYTTKGTAMALVEQKVFGSETTVHEHYKTGTPSDRARALRCGPYPATCRRMRSTFFPAR